MIRGFPPSRPTLLLAGLLLSWTGAGGCAWGWDDDDTTAGDDDADDDATDDDAGDDDGGDDDSGDDDAADDDSGDDDSGDDDTVPAAAVEQHSYFLDLSTFDVTYPPGVGYALSLFLPKDHGPVFMVTAVDDLAGTCSVRSGAAYDSEGDPDLDDWAQDLDVATDTPPCSWSNPTMGVGPIPSIDIVVPNTVTGHLLDISFEGDFATDGSALTDVELEGLMDLYSMDVWQEEPPGTACAYLDKFGFPCVPCPAGPHQGEVFCAELEAELGTAPQLPGLTLAVVTP